MFTCNCQAMPPYSHFDQCVRCQKIHSALQNNANYSPYSNQFQTDSWNPTPGTMNYSSTPIPSEFINNSSHRAASPLGQWIGSPGSNEIPPTNVHCPILRQHYMQHKMMNTNLPNQQGSETSNQHNNKDNQPVNFGFPDNSCPLPWRGTWAQPGWYGVRPNQNGPGMWAFRDGPQPVGLTSSRDLSDSWTQTPGDPTFRPIKTPSPSSSRAYGKAY